MACACSCSSTGGGPSTEVQAAGRFLRTHGSPRLALVGASFGGAVVIDAAVHLHPAPAAVIGLSAAPEAVTYPIIADTKRLTSPTMQVGSIEDLLTLEGQTTRGLYRASPSRAKKLLLLPGTDHGTDFVGPLGSTSLRKAIVDFILEHVR